MRWQIQEAKARFSEMVERTLREGPQTVTCHGKPVAVLVGADQYQRLRAGGKTFKALLASAPLRGVEILRSRDRARVIERASRRVRKESMRVNAEFAAIERNPDSSAR
jgi:prevent-host-death family protein